MEYTQKELASQYLKLSRNKQMHLVTPEQRTAYREKYRNNNPKLRYYSRVSDCKKRTPNTDITKEFLMNLAQVTTHCVITGLELDYTVAEGRGGVHKDNKAELDRIEPELGYMTFNVRWISRKANRMKQDTDQEMLTRLLADRLGVSYETLLATIKPLL